MSLLLALVGGPRTLIADSQAFSVDGLSASGTITRGFTASNGVVNLLGFASTGSSAYKLFAETGSINVSGKISTFNTVKVLDSGTFTIGAVNTALIANRLLKANNTQITVTGANATLAHVRYLYTGSDNIGLSGNLSIGTHKYVLKGNSNQFNINWEPVTFVLNKLPVTISFEQAQKIMAIAHLHGLVDTLEVSPVSRQTTTINQVITGTDVVNIFPPVIEELPWNAALIDDLAAIHGIGVTLTVTATERIAGAVTQSISVIGNTTTITRQ